MNEMVIDERVINSERDPLIIAEIGINHNGSIKIAKEMVDAAYNCGVEVIKHQTHIVEDEMSPHANSVIPGNAKKSIYQIMSECALSEDDEYELMNYVKSKGMIFISTPFSRAAAYRLKEFNIPAYKIGSGECNNYPLIEIIASFGKPVILSTGMNDINSVSKAVSILRKYKVPYALMHCTNLYPTPAKLVRLGAMNDLKKEFKDAIIGLSDHTDSNLACLGAVALGAELLERHFTDSMSRVGPDIVCSMDPESFIDLKESSHQLKMMRGGHKCVIKEEKVTSDFAFASVVSIADIHIGEKLTKENIWVKRPGTGEISAEEFNRLIGKTAMKNIKRNKHICWDDLNE